jgi:putative peptidoglycan lipid II flippase
MSNDFPDTKKGSRDGFLRRMARFSGSTFISRILGLVREQVMSHFFGAGIAVDSFNAAFRIPNLLRDFFAEGALSVAYVPVFSEKLKKEGKEQAFLLTSTILTVLSVILGVISLIGILIAPWIVRIIAPGFSDSPGQMELTIAMTRIMFPFLAFVAGAAAIMGTLNCFGKFGLPALAPAGFNLASIVAGIFFRQYFDPPILVMAWGATTGGVVQMMMQVPQLYKLGFRFRIRFSFADSAVGKIIKLMGPAAIGVAAAQLNIIVGTLLASLQPTGSISYLSYAFRLMHFPLGVFGVAVAAVSLPELSAIAAEGKTELLFSKYIRSCRTQLLFLWPSALFLIVGARPICALIYQHGKFGWQDSINAAYALQAYSVGLIFFGLVRLAAQVFYAHKNTATPVRISMITVGINIIISLLLMKPLGFVGLALAPGISAAANFTMLTFNIRKKIGHPDYSQLYGVFAKATLAAGVGSAITYIILRYFRNYEYYGGLIHTIPQLAIAFITGIAIFAGLGYLLGIFRRNAK